MARITQEVIDPREPVRRVERSSAGAVLTFAGVVRDRNRGREVRGIEYHAYEAMALSEMERIETAVKAEWPEVAVDIVHRIGSLRIGETSVLIAVSSPHRADGFAALRRAIEMLKESVPIWKKEVYADGHAWIEGS